MYPYIKIFNFSVPTYGLFVCIAILLCAILVFKKAKENVDYNDLTIILTISIGCAMLGGPLLYIFVTYDFETIYKQILLLDFSFLNNLGTIFYGGLVSSILGAIITIKILKIEFEYVEKCIVPYIPLGHAIGRIGCLLAGCCYGFPYNGIFAISTRFDNEEASYFPIQIVESFFNLLIMAILLLYTKKKRPKYSIIVLYLIMYSSLRFCLEFFRGDSIRGSFLIFSTSQWISLIIFSFSTTIILIKFLKIKITKINIKNK